MCAGTNLFFDAMWVIEHKYLLFSGTSNSKSSPTTISTMGYPRLRCSMPECAGLIPATSAPGNPQVDRPSMGVHTHTAVLSDFRSL